MTCSLRNLPQDLLHKLPQMGAALLALSLLPAWAASERGLEGRTQPSALSQADEGRVIVKFRDTPALRRGLDESRVGELAQRAGAPLQAGRHLGERMHGLRSSGLSSRDLMLRMASQPEVEWVEIDHRRSARGVLPNDPYFGAGQTAITPAVGQWYLRAPDSTVVSAIDAPGAWAVTQGNASVTVAVLDTGVRFSHPDLAGKLFPGYDFISSNTPSASTNNNRYYYANDGDGRDPDPSDPGDWNANGECGGSSAQSSSWHGTQVSGLVGAATDNGIGMASIGRNIMVLPIRVLGRCGGYDSDIIAGMRWAAGISSDVSEVSSRPVNVPNPNPARILNLSLGSPGACPRSYSDLMKQLEAANVLVVAAAGNDVGFAVDSPANCPNVLAVAGVRHIGTKVGFSNVGPEVGLAAPGGNCVNLSGGCLYPLLTTINDGTRSPGNDRYSDGGNYASVGTSFASPLVAGTAGLMLSVYGGLSAAQLRDVLKRSASPFSTTGASADTTVCQAPSSNEQLECYCTTSTCGAGMLNASRAIALTQALKPAAVNYSQAASAEQLAVRLYQAIYGRAPGTAALAQLAATISASGESAAASSLAASAFSGVGNAQLAQRVLDNLSVTAATVTTPGSYTTLLGALSELFAAYGPAARGQIILNASRLLRDLIGDPTWGGAATLFMAQLAANYAYSKDSANIAPGEAGSASRSTGNAAALSLRRLESGARGR